MTSPDEPGFDRAAGGDAVPGPRSASLRLSARAREVLDHAHELARREPGFEPHSGHLLIALARAGGALIEDTLLRLGLDYEDILAAVESAGGVADAKRELGDVLAAAARIADADNQGYIAAAALAGGLVAAREGVATRALTALGVSAERLTALLDAPRDMLVPLLALPDPAAAVERAARAGVRIRRARAWEAPALATFIEAERFARTWAPETHNAFARQPVAVFLAEREGRLAGFAAYDCGLRGIFGPTGVARGERARGIAAALLLRTLADMRAAGYAYAIIGAVGPSEFYERVCNAVLLPSSWPSYVTSAE